MAKIYTENSYKFVCDGCGLVAGAAPMESIALQMARNTANVQGWQWSHPHWGLRCPSCRSTQYALDAASAAHAEHVQISDIVPAGKSGSQPRQ